MATGGRGGVEREDKKLRPRKFRKIEITDAWVNDAPLSLRRFSTSNDTGTKINNARAFARTRRNRRRRRSGKRTLASFLRACLPCKVILCILRRWRFRRRFRSRSSWSLERRGEISINRAKIRGEKGGNEQFLRGSRANALLSEMISDSKK